VASQSKKYEHTVIS